MAGSLALRDALRTVVAVARANDSRAQLVAATAAAADVLREVPGVYLWW